MKFGIQNVLGSVVGGSLLLTLAVPKAAPATAVPDGARRYEVTVQNVTAGQIFSPVLAATHRDDVSIFQLGGRSSDELALLAEEGDNSALMVALQRDSHVSDVVSADDVLVPGTRVRFTIERDRRAEYFSMAAMLVSTNDAFVGADRLPLPKGREATRHLLYAYDAGTEFNSESCEFVPGPPCRSPPPCTPEWT